MELKFVEDQFGADWVSSSNRTFMELKFVEDQFGADWVSSVLIAPLWN